MGACLGPRGGAGGGAPAGSHWHPPPKRQKETYICGVKVAWYPPHIIPPMLSCGAVLACTDTLALAKFGIVRACTPRIRTFRGPSDISRVARAALQPAASVCSFVGDV